MYDIRADLKNNILLMRLEGKMSDQELKEGADHCISEAKKLKAGYTIINDISKMKPATTAGEQEIVRVQSFVVNHGVGIIIRVVNDRDTKSQFQKTEDQAGYTAIQARSVDEAYEILNL